MQAQKGFTLITLMFFLALAVIVSMIGFRVVPTYMKYYTVKQTLKNILADGGPQSNEALRTSFVKRLDVNYIKDLSETDLEIATEGGMLYLTVPIQSKDLLFGGVGVYVELEATASAPLK